LNRDAGESRGSKDEVSYGYRTVTSADKRRLVDEHFETIAPRYDLADAILSFGLDSLWRRAVVRRLSLKRGERVLDLCGGTAGLAALAAPRVGRDGTVTVCDTNRAMMLTGRSRAARSRHGENILWVQGDAENLGFPDSAFDAVMVGFGVRNLAHVDRGLSEIFRVLKRGGKLAILEFSLPEARWLRGLYGLYSFGIMPFAGKVITGTAEPFAYLAESIRVFPKPEHVKTALEASGFARVTFRRLTNGIAVAYHAEKPIQNPSQSALSPPVSL
jgi:demethylmenaquinone methyltransferase/2-methoxy-6-polyprenyl-1,4-benzoquinol methylase